MKIKLLAKNVVNFIVDVIVDVFYTIPVRIVRKFVVLDEDLDKPPLSSFSNFWIEMIEVLLVTAVLSIIPIVGATILAYGIVLRLLIVVELVVAYVTENKRKNATADTSTGAEPAVA